MIFDESFIGSYGNGDLGHMRTELKPTVWTFLPGCDDKEWFYSTYFSFAPGLFLRNLLNAAWPSIIISDVSF